MTSSKLFDSPTVPPLRRLIEDVLAGGILVPKFQRDFVWTSEQRLDLLDSVLRGMPIGSLFVWKTRVQGVDAEALFGARVVRREPDHDGSLVTRTFLLDGLQRVTTLIDALAPREQDDPVDAAPTVYYDLAATPQTPTRDRLLVRPRKKDGRIDPTLLPLYKTLDDFAMSDFQGALSNFEESARRAMIRESQRVASTLKDYPVPIVPIVSDDLDLVTESFQRVNSTGTPMSEQHMANALTFTSGTDLPKRISGVAQALAPSGWGQLDSRVIFASLKAALRIELSKPRPSELQRKLAALKKVGEDPFVALDPNARAAANFLVKHCHIHGPEVLPYTYQFVALCEAAARHDLNAKAVQERYARWFWATTFSELFASMNSTQLARAIDFARSFGSTPVADASKLLRAEVGGEPIRRLTRYNFNGARTRALSVILGCAAAEYAPDAHALDMLGAEGNVAMQVFTRSCPQSATGNRVLLRATETGPLRELLRHPLDGTVVMNAARHLIPNDALEAWRNGDEEGFVRLRSEHLWEREKDFIARVVPDVFAFED